MDDDERLSNKALYSHETNSASSEIRIKDPVIHSQER